MLVQPLDRAGAALEARFRQMTWTPRQVNFAHMAVWIALFAVMITTGFVGGRHPGSDPGFWQKACESGKGDACQTWVRTMNVNCQHGSGLACLTLGVEWNEGRVVPRDRAESAKNFARACDLKMQYACPSLMALVKENGPGILRPSCELGDGESCFILASLYYAGGGVPKSPKPQSHYSANLVPAVGRAAAAVWRNATAPDRESPPIRRRPPHISRRPAAAA